jgi:hypothetical protein
MKIKATADKVAITAASDTFPVLTPTPKKIYIYSKSCLTRNPRGIANHFVILIL